jgi:DNA-binding NarL/FixJ family response regulator
MTAPTTVAILNTNDDVVEMLRIALEHAGFVVVSEHVDDVRRGEASLNHLMQEHDPKVIIYDLTPPYDRSWRFLEHVCGMPYMAARKVVVTSTNAARAVELSGGATHVHEILGKPYDIDEIVQAVQSAAGRAVDRSSGLRRV